MISKPELILNNEQITSIWSSIADSYSRVDGCMQATFYSLSNMLNLPQANNILEVACGTGRLLPYALGLKSEHCNYLATDIAPNMLDLAKSRLQHYIRKLGVKENFEEWLTQQRLQFIVQNGEEPIKTELRFDRMILNLVLHITENPQKMLRNLHAHAEKGCLMGLAVPGNAELSNFFPIAPQLEAEYRGKGLQISQSRSYYHLYRKVGELAEKSGWEVVMQWEESGTFSYYEVEEGIISTMKEIMKLKGEGLNLMVEKVKKVFEEKRNLTMPIELYLLRKK